MTPTARERVEAAIRKLEWMSHRWALALGTEVQRKDAREALTAALDALVAEVREECAKIAETIGGRVWQRAERIAVAIRARR